MTLSNARLFHLRAGGSSPALSESMELIDEVLQFRAECDSVGVSYDATELVRHHRDSQAAADGAWDLVAQMHKKKLDRVRGLLETDKDTIDAKRLREAVSGDIRDL